MCVYNGARLNQLFVAQYILHRLDDSRFESLQEQASPFFYKIRIFGARTASYSMGTGFIAAAKAARVWKLSGFEVKNERSYTSAAIICLHEVGWRNFFCFTFLFYVCVCVWCVCVCGVVCVVCVCVVWVCV